MYALIVYIPEDHVEQVKSSIFDAGGGKIGDYEHCAWQSLGMGQFKALTGANPFVGDVGAVHQEPEWRVEIVVADECMAAVLAALVQAHPYEEPAYQYFQINPPLAAD